MSSDERALRDALEAAQARVGELTRALEAAEDAAQERELELETYIDVLERTLQKEASARDEAHVLVEKLSAAVEEADDPREGFPIQPGERKELVLLRAQLSAQRHTHDRMEIDYANALETIDVLRVELLKFRKK